MISKSNTLSSQAIILKAILLVVNYMPFGQQATNALVPYSFKNEEIFCLITHKFCLGMNGRLNGERAVYLYNFVS